MNSLIKHRNDINKQINSRKNKYEDKKDEERNASEDKKRSKNHTAIVYGRLPPECRKSQALKFN